MADLKEMTERVVEKEEETIRQDVEEKRKKAEDEVQTARSEIEEKRPEKKESIDMEADRQYNIQKNTLEIQQRNEILSAKQKIITDVLNKAKNELNYIDKEQFQKFTSGVLEQFEGEDDVDLILGEYSQDKITQKWLNRLALKNLQVNMSEEVINNQSGIIVKKGGIEYNFLFDELVDNMKADIVPKITEELFN